MSSQLTLDHGLSPARSAKLSGDERYRYALERRWGSGPLVLWVMLNPSTADAYEDDATIRRCVGFARRWGYGGILVGNLYAFRATNPNLLAMVDDPVGPDNDFWLTTLAARARVVVAAWGAHYMAPRRVHVLPHLVAPVPLLCLGWTRDGYPRHPVRLPYATKAEPWETPGAEVGGVR